jgi:hypothetical protein
VNFELLGLGTLSLVCAFILKSLSYKGAPVFSGICILIILTRAFSSLSGIIPELLSLADSIKSLEIIKLSMKILAVGYLFGICADLCREMGENGIAKALDLSSRVEIIIMLLPYFAEIIRLGGEVL